MRNDKRYKKDSRYTGKGKSPKGKCNPEMDYEEETKRGKDRKGPHEAQPNDWRWYAQNEQLLIDSASFSYNTPLGTIVRRTVKGDQPVDGAGVPGVMAIYTTPAYGNSGSAVSPLNVAVRNIYSYVRHANSGHSNYDAPDLGVYLMAMDNVYSFLAYLRRIYGVAMTYSYTNKYYPVAITNAMGVSFEDVHQHLADFRAMINSIAVKVGSMCVPSSMAVFARHMWMYEGYYTDTDQNKAQTYMYVPTGFYQYRLRNKELEGGVYDTSGMLVYKPLTPYGLGVQSKLLTEDDFLKVSDLHEYAEALLEPILRSEDMNIMSGDILKAYGSAGVYMVPMIPENYVVVPTYSREVLDQINNCTLIGDNLVYSAESDFDEGWNVLVQDPNHGYLIGRTKTLIPISQANMTVNTDRLTAKAYLNFDHDGVTPADSMVASRLTNIYDPNDVQFNTENGKYGIVVAPSSTSPAFTNTTGTDVANYARLFYYSREGLIMSDMISAIIPVLLNWDFTIFGNQGDLNEVVANVVEMVQYDTARINMVTNFRRHPRVAYQYGVHIAAYDSAGSSFNATADGKYVADISDLNQWTVVDANDLQGMAETALLSEFNVTQYGRKA